MNNAHISIVTPWLNASELCPMYAKSVIGAEVIIVDNGSEWMHARKIERMAQDLEGVYIRNETNNHFAQANNQGLKAATGDIVVFLNNDVECHQGWLLQVQADVLPGVLAGPSLLNRHDADYIEGYCIAARRDIWDTLGGWPADLPGMYWEDNILCLEAVKRGIKLVKTNWNVWHFNNYTSRTTPGAYDHSAANQAEFLRRLANYAR